MICLIVKKKSEKVWKYGKLSLQLSSLRCLSGEAAAANQQTDVRSVHVYENQRWNPMTGYADK